MKLYEIDAAIESLIDDETGEIMDMDAFEALAGERDAKLEGVALAYKNYAAEAAAIKAEAKSLTERATALSNKAEGYKEFLARVLDGQTFKTPRVAVQWRTSNAVEVTDSFLPWAKENNKFLRYKDPEPDKAALADFLKGGGAVPGADMVSRKSMSIK